MDTPIVPADASIRLSLLGGFALFNSAGAELDLAPRKSRLLLAYLVASGDRAHSRDHLAALLWSDRQDEQARGSLRTALSDIRRALGSDALVVSGDAVRLRRGVLVADLDLLRAGADPQTSAEFRPGEFLAGHDVVGAGITDWLRDMRDECSELGLKALERRADHLSRTGRAVEAITLLRRCLALEPLKESNHRALMRLYSASGERAMALAQFRTCREILMHELGVEPAPETTTLADDIALNDDRQIADLRAAGERSHPVPDSTEAPLAPPATASIAVLPFVNMSGDADQNYFADGVTEDIITDLAAVEGLAVAANIASQMYRGGAFAPDRIARELDVRYILEGSVRAAGQSLRISARLVDAPANRQVWAERFDRRIENIFELQSDIASAIVLALRSNIGAGSTPVRVARTTRHSGAYQEYLRARGQLREMTRRSLEMAKEGFHRAVDLDPGYAEAWAGLAESNLELAFHYSDADEDIVQALSQAATAVRLAPESAEALAARGYARVRSGDEAGGVADIKEAIERDPTLSFPHIYLALAHLTLNEIEAALSCWRNAFACAEQELRTGMMFMSMLNARGGHDELQAVAGKVAATCHRRLALNPHDERAAYVLAGALYNLGETHTALRWAEIAAAFGTEDSRTHHNLACLFALLGDNDQALKYLALGLGAGHSDHKIEWIRYNDPDLSDLRKDPRFEALFAAPDLPGPR